MKFASGFEILEYCQAIATRYKFYDKCLFHTTVEQTVWNEDEQRWHVHTDRGDVMRARHVVLANGILTSPRLARIDGMETFKGIRSTRQGGTITSIWKVSVSALSARVQRPFRQCRNLRKWSVSCTYFSARRHRSIFEISEPQHQKKLNSGNKNRDGLARRNRLATINSGRSALLGDDAYLSGKIAEYKPKKQHAKKLSPEELVQKQLNTSFRIMEQIRSRVTRSSMTRKQRHL